jgi:DNA-binding NtrC family response regulator
VSALTGELNVSAQLVLVQESPSPLKTLLDRVLSAHSLACRTLDWESLNLERLSDPNTQLIIAVAVPLVSEAISLFKQLAETPISTPVVVLLPRDIDDETLSIVSRSAVDFILWPVHKGELRYRLERILGGWTRKEELDSAHEGLTEVLGLEQIMGRHPAFLNAIQPIPLIAESGLPLLITGPTGTGKELCARGVHNLSKRRHFPFIAVDCGAIPDHLFENEFFGHARGAFTDAHSDQKGLAAIANGGTLLLDEIDALSLGAQAKLLRFLQERAYRPLGSEKFVKADVNVIAATNRDIERHVRDQLFRADLYFRLNVMRIELPPLRVRGSDIELLARHFLQLHCSTHRLRKSFSPAALRKLETYEWPGNVRELLNVVQRAAVLCEGAYILPAHIPLAASEPVQVPARAGFQLARSKAIEAFEKRYVESLLVKHNGNVTRAAIEAGKDRRAFGRLKKKYNIAC